MTTGMFVYGYAQYSQILKLLDMSGACDYWYVCIV